MGDGIDRGLGRGRIRFGTGFTTLAPTTATPAATAAAAAIAIGIHAPVTGLAILTVFAGVLVAIVVRARFGAFGAFFTRLAGFTLAVLTVVR
jgi:hypothetical protein